MIKFVYGSDLGDYPMLQHSMFQDRAAQFATRHGWDVSVDTFGEERDEYDVLNPLYVIAVDPFGRHHGSMRLLPTVGRTMVNEHFSEAMNGVMIRSPFIWECTRFCISERAPRTVTPLLLAAGGKLMREFGLKHYVGVFDEIMHRIYARIGSSPTIQGTCNSDSGLIHVGLWQFDDLTYRKLLRRAGIDATEMELYFANSSTVEEQYRQAS